MRRRTHFVIESHGSISLFRPITDAAHRLVEAHMPEDASDWCGAVVVEHRSSARSSVARSATGWWCGDGPLRQAYAARAYERRIPLMLLGPLAFVVRCVGRRLKQLPA